MDEAAFLLLPIHCFDPQESRTILRACRATDPFSGPIGRAKPTTKKNPLLKPPRLSKDWFASAIRAIAPIPKSLGSRSVQTLRDVRQARQQCETKQREHTSGVATEARRPASNLTLTPIKHLSNPHVNFGSS